MTVWQRLLEKFTAHLHSPQEVFLDLPHTIFVGNRRVLIEDHKGVLEYSPQKIRLRIREGELMITGQQLRIVSIFAHEVLIDGRFTGVQFVMKG